MVQLALLCREQPGSDSTKCTEFGSSPPCTQSVVKKHGDVSSKTGCVTEVVQRELTRCGSADGQIHDTKLQGVCRERDQPIL